MLSCSDCLARHSEYLDGLLDPAGAQQVREHLASCGECGRYDRVLRRGLTLLTSQPQLEPTADFSLNLHQRLHAEERNAHARPISSLSAATVAVAAMVAFAAWLPTLMLSGGNTSGSGAQLRAESASAVATEIAWHGESAVEQNAPAHIHLARSAPWSASGSTQVLEPKYSPVVLESPVAPLSYSTLQRLGER